MNIRKIASLVLAAALQVLPITRVFVATAPASGSSFAVVSTWIAGALALMGGVDAVSGASTTITSPTTARGTNGVPFSYRITTGPEVANTFSAVPLPTGLTVNTSSGRITGTPTVSGVFIVQLTASDNGRADRTVRANLTLTIVDGGGGGVIAPAITSQPVNQTVTAGGNASFSVVATGTAPLSYQWRRNGANVNGATSTTLSLSAVTTNQAGSYTCVVTNAAGSATSAAATLTVNPAAVAPAITTQPVSQSVTAGGNVSFTVAASGTAPLSYQWRRNGANVNGATSTTLSLSAVTTNQAGSYTCVVTNAAGSATSAAATLTVNPAAVAPAITTQPVSQSVTAGGNVSFTVAASGTAPLSYQWRRNGANLAGATSPTLNLTAVTTNQAGSYTCVVTNAAGSATSAAAVLTVTALPVAPTITSQPVSQSVIAGGNASFTVAVSGTAPFGYQWQLNGVNITGATSATLNRTGVTTNQAGSYTCVVTNVVGSTTSAAATLTVNVSPSITTQPVSQTVTAGANVTFTVTASGTAPLSYQWRRNGANVAGATNPSLTLTSVVTNQAGSYTCFVTNIAGNATSAAASLAVNAAPVPPTITTQPITQTVVAGANVSLTVTASGTTPLNYQWRLNGANLAGATAATLTLTSVTTNQAGSYTCFVTNIAGSTTSSAATLAVNPAPVAPMIISQPASQTVNAGASASFSVVASGTAPLSYQWRRNGANVVGASSATLNLTAVTTNQAGTYTCVVTNPAGSATSSGAVLTVQAVVPQASTLTVVIQGQGTVSPNLNGTTLDIGQSYAMTATAASGYTFAGWSGGIPGGQSSAATLNFVMVSNLVLTANFIASPFTAAAGVYNGLFFESDEVRLRSAGAFNLRADASGNYSGWLQLGFIRYSFSGKLDADLRATNTITRWNASALALELQLGQNSEAGQVSGQVSDGMWSANLAGGRSSGPSAFAGDYTLVIPGRVGDARIPAGDSYATLRVGTDGLATMNGVLADGTQFAQSAYVTDEGNWPLYVSLYGAKGLTASWLHFADQTGSDLRGDLVWIKLAGASATSYASGFTNETEAVGSRYVVPPASGKALNLSSAMVNFSGGSLTAAFNNTVSVNAGSQVINLSPNQMTLSITTTSGKFSGQVRDPATGAQRNFGGVVLQKQNAGFGSTAATPLSSRVLFTAP